MRQTFEDWELVLSDNSENEETREMMGAILLTLHNLRTFHRLMEEIRRAIPEGRFEELRRRVLAQPD